VSEKPVPEDHEPAAPEPPVSQPEPDPADKEQIEEFITRHILEKDTVFFEG
jgi:hypothetical protein